MKQKIVVAMSGGVDSSVAACLLHEQGFEVVGFFMRTGTSEQVDDDPDDRHRGCCSARDAGDARYVAGKLGIHFYALNFQQDFDEIIDYFAREYRNGRTPNPCVMCNDRLKFGKLLEYGASIGADAVATGHYARIGVRAGQPVLQRGVDAAKDQSYFLFGLQRDVLERVRFPIGGLTKDQVRAEARRFGLPISEKPDSVDICFVPDRDYVKVVAERQPEGFRPGPVVDAEGQAVGEHDGVARFTIGQRRGLGIAMGLPIYVTGIDAASNTVQIGSQDDLFKSGLVADRVNWLIKPRAATFSLHARIRYQHTPTPATVTCGEDQRVSVQFDTPQRAVTPGQAVAFYDGEDCLGGGWIQAAVD